MEGAEFSLWHNLMRSLAISVEQQLYVHKLDTV